MTKGRILIVVGTLVVVVAAAWVAERAATGGTVTPGAAQTAAPGAGYSVAVVDRGAVVHIDALIERQPGQCTIRSARVKKRETETGGNRA